MISLGNPIFVPVTDSLHFTPDYDAVLACALAAQVDLIVSGDAHLLDLKHYQRIEIVNSSEALRILANPPQSV